MQERGNCYLCDHPATKRNEAGGFVCDWCDTQLKANPEVEDETAYHQAICTHPYKSIKNNKCLYCGKVFE